jgi:hypothetical protein
MSVAGIVIEGGINVGGGINIGASGSGPSGPLTFTYGQIVATQDQSMGAGGNGTGVVIVNAVPGTGGPGVSTGPGIAFSTTPSQETYIAGLTPIPGAAGFGGTALQYTATWSAGSTYATTPVQVEYYPTFAGNPDAWVIYVLNSSATAGQTGTFNFPVTFTAVPNTTITVFP